MIASPSPGSDPAAFYETLLGAAPVITVVLDAQTGDRVYVSPEFTRITGLTLDAYRALDQEARWELIHVDDREIARATWADFVAAGGAQPATMRYRYRSPNGWRWFAMTTSAVSFDDTGDLRLFMVTGIDVTDQVAADEQRESLLESAPILASIIDVPSGRRTYLSPEFTRVTGLTVDEYGPMHNEARTSLIHPDDRDRVGAAWAAFQATDGVEGQQVTYRLQTVEGWRWFVTFARVLSRTVDGSLERVMITGLDVTREREAEEAERVYLAGSVAMVNIYDPDEQRVEYVNDLFAEVTGHTLASLGALEYEELRLLYGPDGPAVTAAAVRSLETGEPQDVQHQLRYADGTVHTVLSRFVGREVGGRPKLHQSSVDITAQVEADAYRRAVLEASPAAIWVHRIDDGGIDYVSPVFEELTGHDLDGLAALPTPLQQLVPLDDRAPVDAAIAKTLDREVGEARHRTRHADGTLHWYQSRFARFGDDPVHPRVLVSSMAISAQMEAESLTQTILDANPNIVLVWDPDTMVAEFANPAFTAVTGYTAEDLNSLDRSSVPSLVHPDDVAGEEAAIGEAIATGASTHLLHRVRTRSGEWRWFDTVYISFPDVLGATPRRILVTSTDVTEREASEGFRDAILDVTPAMTVVFDADDNRMVYANAAYEEQTGLTLDEANELHQRGDMTPPEDRPRVAAAIQETLRTGEMTTVRRRYRWRDGTMRWFDTRFLRFPDPTGRYRSRLVSTAVDVTEQIEIERLNETVVGESPITFLVYDHGERAFEWANPAFTEVTGFSVDDLNAQGPTTSAVITHEDDLEHEELVMRTALETGKPTEIRHRLVCADGRVRTFDSKFIRLDDDTRPSARRLLMSSVDVTDRLEAEELADTIVQSSPAMTLLVDLAQATVLFVSDSFTEVTGYTAASFSTGERPLGMVTEADQPKIYRAVEDAMRTGEVQSVEVTYRLADGSIRWFDTRLLRMGGPHAPQVLITAIDTTERHLAEEALQSEQARLERANRDLEDFAYIASHDLQEPLRTVTAFVDLLHDEVPDALSDDARTYLRFIGEGTERMRRLVAGLLDLSGIGRDRVVRQVDLDSLVAEIAADLSDQIEREGGRLDIDPLPVISGDPTELRLIFQNLITNGFKFRSADRAPVVRVRSRSVAEGVRFEVEDNGIGIAANHLDRVFTIFQRLNAREAYEGVGIGLAHSKRAVENHEGEIGVVSIVGEGSTFWFTIPEVAQR